MLRLASDADVDGNVVRALRRESPELDLVRVQGVGLREASDPVILEWAADQGRVLITQDVNTMVGFAWERVRAGRPTPGVISVLPESPTGAVIEDILLMAHCGDEGDLRDQVVFVPQARS